MFQLFTILYHNNGNSVNDNKKITVKKLKCYSKAIIADMNLRKIKQLIAKKYYL